MKIVIDVPKEQYITINATTQKDVVTVIDDRLRIKAIKNGTPLPDGAEILTKEAYSDLCMMAAERPEKRTEKRTETHSCVCGEEETHEKRTDPCGDCISRQAAISELKPPTDNWETYADRLYDLAYLSGYNDGLIAKGNQDNNV